MTQAVCRNLIEHGAIEQKSLCMEFVRDYLHQPNRGYGQDITTVFRKLQKNQFEDVLGPASEQFNGNNKKMFRIKYLKNNKIQERDRMETELLCELRPSPFFARTKVSSS